MFFQTKEGSYVITYGVVYPIKYIIMYLLVVCSAYSAFKSQVPFISHVVEQQFKGAAKQKLGNQT